MSKKIFTRRNFLVLFLLLVVVTSVSLLLHGRKPSNSESENVQVFTAPPYATNLGIMDQIREEKSLVGYQQFINVPKKEFNDVAKPGLIGVFADPNDFEFVGQKHEKWGQWCYFPRDITEIHLKGYQLVSKPDTSINTSEFLQFCQDQVTPVDVYVVTASVDGDITITVTKTSMSILVKFE